MAMMIAGRTVQGLGGGGIQSVTMIILADMVSLEDRGVYASIFGYGALRTLPGRLLVDLSHLRVRGARYSVSDCLLCACFVATVSKRALKDLNLPLAGFAGITTFIFMRLPTPPGTFSEKIRRVDWIGNGLIVGSTTACALALTWGGVTFSWSSPRVLVPLVLGIVGFIVSVVYEAKWASNPLVIQYLQTFLVGVVALGVVYYIPAYLQACKGASPIRSGVVALGLASLAPVAMTASILVKRTSRYRPQMWFGRTLTLIGLGLVSTITASTSQGRTIGFLVLAGVGRGYAVLFLHHSLRSSQPTRLSVRYRSVYSTTVFPIQAPLPVTLNAPALALLMFCRSFATVCLRAPSATPRPVLMFQSRLQIWGVTIGSTVLQNQLTHRLSASGNLSSFLSQYPQGVSIAYAIIPDIKSLPEPLRTTVRDAFADSLRVLWLLLIGIGGLGALSSLLMKGLALHTHTDEKWAMQAESEKETPQVRESSTA
ncbi:hypothetical protein EW146_g4959 [Bondarzewia mesenterica]|uniref:Major facilitator superfamily (MFS) profile domain-containing protein n=1 Tax=Bondarzewia mesenterica TaxID=1095465 RepID=A0A4S4LYQ0_9AGAM|nr:hypothetical protein EW146_g4959 [Bondarzewia mesenterica]